MEKKIEIERAGLKDLKRIMEASEASRLKPIIIGGYAVRAYTKTHFRYTNDIDLIVRSTKELSRLKFVLKKIGYRIRERPHGLSGFRRTRGVPIVINVRVEEMASEKREITPFYPEIEPIKVRVASIEDILISKARTKRDMDIIDFCILLLDSFESLNYEELKKKLEESSLYSTFLSFTKDTTDLVGTKKFHDTWESFIGKKMKREDEKEIWVKLTALTKNLSAKHL